MRSARRGVGPVAAPLPGEPVNEVSPVCGARPRPAEGVHSEPPVTTRVSAWRADVRVGEVSVPVADETVCPGHVDTSTTNGTDNGYHTSRLGVDG